MTSKFCIPYLHLAFGYLIYPIPLPLLRELLPEWRIFFLTLTHSHLDSFVFIHLYIFVYIVYYLYICIYICVYSIYLYIYTCTYYIYISFVYIHSFII